MNSRFYGLVKQNDEKIRIWEILEGDDYMWGNPVSLNCVLRYIILVIGDLVGQKKCFNRLFTESELEMGYNRYVEDIKRRYPVYWLKTPKK